MQDYSEVNTNPRVSGTVSDSEQGWVPGFGARASTMFNAFGVENIYASVRYNYNNGNTSYQGRSVNYPYASISESSGEIVNNAGVEIGKGFLLLSGRAMVIPLVQAGYHSWDRLIPGGFSPEEVYTYFSAGVGVRGNYALTDRVVLSGKIGWEYMIGAADQTSANPFFSKPANRLTLGARPIYEVSVGADYRLTEHLHTFLQADYSRFGFGQSAPAYYTVGAQQRYEFEPSSETDNLLVQLGVAWTF